MEETQTQAVAPEERTTDAVQPTTTEPGKEASSNSVAPATEPAKEPVKGDGTKPKNDDFAPRFAALSRKERQIRERERTIQERESKLDEYRKAKEGARDNIEGYLKAAGLTIQDVAEYVVNGRKPSAKPQVDERVGDEIKALRAELEAERKERLSKEYQLTQKAAGESLERYLAENKETFPVSLALKEEAIPLAFQIANQYYEETGESPDVLDIFKRIEGHFVESEKARIERLKSVGPFASFFSPPEATKQNGIAPETAGQKTLTNAPGVTKPNGKTFRTPAEEINYYASLIKTI